jgi:hypothetical protein
MFTIEYAKNPIWNDAEHTSVHLTVKFAEFEEELPFNATLHDPMQYGVELYNRAISGEFGVIVSFENIKD